MQEAHQQAQQNKPTSGSITGSGDFLGFKFFAPDDWMLIVFTWESLHLPVYFRPFIRGL